jgi:hypothetical protein
MGQKRPYGHVGSNVRFAPKRSSSGHRYTVLTLHSVICRRSRKGRLWNIRASHSALTLAA